MNNIQSAIKKTTYEYFSPITDVFKALCKEVTRKDTDFSIRSSMRLFFIPWIALYQNFKRRVNDASK